DLKVCCQTLTPLAEKLSANNENDQLPKDYCSLFNNDNKEKLSQLIDNNILNEETNLTEFNEINFELKKSLATNEACNELNNPFHRAKIGHKADIKEILKILHVN
ncbi:30935_t:CDS:2, partial [Gigaspora margarita]